MELALYHPEYGYYTSGRVRIGERDGDFITAPHVSMLFGRCMARLVAMADRALGEPEVFTLIEGGPGEGVLAKEILDTLAADHPLLYQRLTYLPDEVSPALAKRQREILSAHSDKIGAMRDIDAGEACGLHLSNELLDAMPVHWVGVEGGEVFQVCAKPGPEGFARCRGEIKDAEVFAEVRRMAANHPGEDFTFEINPAAGPWLSSVASKFKRGFIVAVDYGDMEERLYGPQRPDGSVRCFAEGGFAPSPFETPGELDITASVNFSVLLRQAAELGLDTLPLMNQRDFLFASGIADEMKREEQAAPDEAALMAVRQELWPLLFSGTGMGESFKAFVAGVGVTAKSLELDPEAALSRLQP
jgi:SAM-dependent MidA family methyltransferase